MRIDLCRSCDAMVVWTRTTNGKPMPVDADPHPDGTVLPIPNTEGGTTGEVIPKLLRHRYDGKLHRSHFATCPNASSHRKATGRPRPSSPPLQEMGR